MNPITTAATYNVSLNIGSCQNMLAGFVLDLLLCNQSLPVNLSKFEVRNVNQKPLLVWTTMREENNKGFAIEHSANGSTWDKVGFVNSKAENGSSTTENNYTFTHINPHNGINYYRLKQEDFNGKYEYSFVKQVRIKSGENKNISIVPNPAKESIKIIGFNDKWKVTIFDYTGKPLIQLAEYNSSQSIDIKTLNNGIYILELIDDSNYKSTHKLIIEK